MHTMHISTREWLGYLDKAIVRPWISRFISIVINRIKANLSLKYHRFDLLSRSTAPTKYTPSGDA